MAKNKKIKGRIRRKRSIRRKINGTAERPRLSVYRSNKHIYVQVIDDVSGTTLAAASTISPSLRDDLGGLKKLDRAKKVGALAAQQCREKDIERVVFDRNGYLYTGRIAAVAEGAREGGLNF